MAKIISILVIFLLLIFSSILLIARIKITPEYIYKNFVETTDLTLPDFQSLIIKNSGGLVPNLYIKDLSITGQNQEEIVLSNVTLKFSIPRLFRLSHCPISVNIKSGLIRVNDLDFGSGENNIFSKLVKLINLDKDINIEQLNIASAKEGDIYEVKKFALTHNFTEDKTIKFTSDKFGKFSVSDNFKNTIHNLKFENLSSFYNIELIGKYMKDGSIDVGSGFLEIFENAKISNLLQEYANKFDFLKYIPSVKQKINIEFDFKIKKQKFLANNFVINDIESSKDSILSLGHEGEMNLHLKNIDLSASYAQRGSEELDRKIDISFLKKIWPEKFNLHIDTIELAENRLIDNFRLSGVFDQQGFSIKEISARIQDGEDRASIILSGDSAKDGANTKFISDIEIESNNTYKFLPFIEFEEKQNNALFNQAKLNAKLILSDYGIMIQDGKLVSEDNIAKINVISNFSGNLPSLLVDVDLGDVNMEQNTHPIFSHVINKILLLGQDMDSPQYFNKFIPLRQFGYSCNVNLFMDTLDLGKNRDNFISSDINFSVRPSRLAIENFYLNYPNSEDFVDAAMLVDANKIKPSLDIKISKASIGYVPDILKLSKYISSNYDIKKIDVNFAAEKININNPFFPMENISLEMKNDQSLFKINKFTSLLWSGEFEMEGNILFSPLQISSIYSLNSIKFDEMSETIADIFGISKGAASISGRFTTNGDSYALLLYNLYAKSSIIAKKFQLRNFAVDDLATNLESSEYKKDNLSADLKQYLNNGDNNIEKFEGDFILDKGKINFSDMNMFTDKTYSEIDGSLNIYDFAINLDMNLYFTTLRYSLYRPRVLQEDRGKNLYTKLPVKITGTLLEHEKILTDIKDLQDVLDARFQRRYFRQMQQNAL